MLQLGEHQGKNVTVRMKITMKMLFFVCDVNKTNNKDNVTNGVREKLTSKAKFLNDCSKLKRVVMTIKIVTLYCLLQDFFTFTVKSLVNFPCYLLDVTTVGHFEDGSDDAIFINQMVRYQQSVK